MTENEMLPCDVADPAVLTLSEEKNFFTVWVSNYGTHRTAPGYGTGDFLTALSGRANVAAEHGVYLNQVKFPFAVYRDCNGDTQSLGITEDDILIVEDTWITLGDARGQFYLGSDQKNGSYPVEFRTIAVNCPTDADGDFIVAGHVQKGANTDSTKYVAVDTTVLIVKSSLEDFVITHTNDLMAQALLQEGQQALTLKKGYEFTYQLWTRGEFDAETAQVWVKPSYFWVSGNGREREQVLLFGSSTDMEERMELYCMDEKEEIPEEPVDIQKWEGQLWMPPELLCVGLDDVAEFEEYSSRQTLTGREEFIKQEGFLVVHFEIEAVSAGGEQYTFTNWEETELAEDALAEGWNYVPGDVIRYDLSQNAGMDYEVGGVE